MDYTGMTELTRLPYKKCIGVSPVTVKPGSTVTRQKQRGREARGKKDYLKQSYKDLSYEKIMKEGLKKKTL